MNCKEKRISKMNISMTTRYWIYLVIAWNIHNLEETLTMTKWYKSNLPKLPIADYISASTIQQIFPVAMTLATLILFLIPILAICRKWDNRIFGIVLGAYLVNAIQHILTTIVSWNYSPGVITALIINLPFSIFMIRQLFKNNLLKNFTWVHIFVYGTILLIIALTVVWGLTMLIYYAFM
jgi:hypothetical protein